MFAIQNPNICSMKKLLALKDVTAMRIMCEPGLSSSIRNSVPELVKFINHRGNLSVLLDVVLTRKFRKLANFDKIEKGALLVFTSQTTSFITPILVNPVFKEKIRAFLISPETKLPKVYGNFAKICESVARFTHGMLLSGIPNFGDWMLSNCFSFAIRFMYANFLIDYPNILVMNEELALKISKIAFGNSGWGAISAVLTLVRSKPDAIKSFQDEIVIDNLAKAALQPNINPQKIICILTLVQKVVDSGFQLPITFLERASRILNFYESLPDSVLIVALPLLKTQNPKILERILLPQTPSRLRQSLLQNFQKMTNDELSNAAKQLNLPSKLMNEVPKQKTNTSILFLSQLLERINFSEKGWPDFTKFVNSRIIALDQNYGGNRDDINICLKDGSEKNSDSSSSDEVELEIGLPEGFGESDENVHGILMSPMENSQFDLFQA